MKKKNLLILVMASSALLVGCGGDPSPSGSDSTSDSSIPASGVTYYLEGNLDLGGVRRKGFVYDETSQSHTLSDITLRRGDSFLLTSSDASIHLNYDDVVTTSLMKEGKNDYVDVLAEGIFSFTIKEGKVNLVKTASSYSSVRLVYADGAKEPIAFTRNSDFTYELEDVDLRYRERFYIDLDGERLLYGDMDHNDIYYEAFKEEDGLIYMEKKGPFDFKIDFDETSPLIVTSENVKPINSVPSNAYEYRMLASSFDDIFAKSASSYIATKIVTDHSSKTVARNDFIETLAINEHYLRDASYSYEEGADETRILEAAEEAGISERAALYNDSNYYEMSIYSGASSSLAPSLSGALINDEATETPEEGDSTMVTIEKEFMTTEEAKDGVLHHTSEATHVESVLNYLVSSSHVSSSSLDEGEIEANLAISGRYLDEVGDRIEIVAKNVEVNFAYYGNSTYIENELTIVIDEEGHLESGIYFGRTYQGSNILVSENGRYTPTENYANYLVKTENYNFVFGYEEKTSVSSYHLDPDKYVVTEIDVASSTRNIGALDTIEMEDLGLMIVDPITGIDLPNYQVISYDSTYFDTNYVGDLTGKGVMGTTTITIGTTYNYVSKDITLNIGYASFTYSSQLGDFRIDDSTLSSSTVLYAGNSYNVELTTFAGYDPAVTISVSDTSAVTISDFPSVEEIRSNGRARFTMTINEAVSGVTLTATSVSSPSISRSVTLNLATPWSTAKVSGDYYPSYLTSSTYGYSATHLRLNADGTAFIEVRDNSSGTTTSYDFNYEVDSEGNFTLIPNENVTAMTVILRNPSTITSSSEDNQSYVRAEIQINSATIAGHSIGSYTSLYTVHPFLDENNKWNIVDEAGTSYQIEKYERESYYEGDIFLSDGSTTSKFHFEAMTGSWGSYDVSYFYPDASSTGYTYSGSLSVSSEGIYTITFGTKTFTFTPVVA